MSAELEPGTLLLTFPAVEGDAYQRCLDILPKLAERTGGDPLRAEALLGRVVTSATKLDVLRRVGVEVDGVDLVLSRIEGELGVGP